MYTDWFKLNKLPFRLRPDPDFIYLSDETKAAYDALRSALSSGQKLVCLLGEPGVGKTTLLHALARDWQESASVARIQQPSLTSEELAATLTAQFALPQQDGVPHRPWMQLQYFVRAQTAQDRAVVILVDEAHSCSSAVLSDLVKSTARPNAPLIVLAGEETLTELLANLDSSRADMPSFNTLRLARLTQLQIAAYLNHRLTIAGNDARELFEPETIADISRYTGGTPQLINTLCDRAMMLAESHSVARVGIAEIRDAVRELNWIEFSARRPLAVPLTDGGAATPPGRSAPALGLEVRRDK
jgi:general secretion pathway protein A